MEFEGDGDAHFCFPPVQSGLGSRPSGGGERCRSR
jgi:hypothetical protein